MVVFNTFEAARLSGSTSPSSLKVGEAAARRASDMIEELMVFSRTGDRGERTTVSLIDIVRRTADVCRGTFDRKIALTDSLPPDLPTVCGNANQLEQVFLNLLLNARDAVGDARPPPPSFWTPRSAPTPTSS